MIYLTLVCLALVAALVVEKYANTLKEREWREERSHLLNRIQAPELAVLPPMEATTYVAPEDDEGFWEAVEDRKAG